MKARHLKDTRGLREKAPGYPSKGHESFPIAAGDIAEGPECWMLCVNDGAGEPPQCEPADDECRDKVAAWNESRAARVRAVFARAGSAAAEHGIGGRLNPAAEVELAARAAAAKEDAEDKE